MGKRKRISGMLALAVTGASFAAACTSDPPPRRNEPTASSIAAKHDALNPNGAERIIPIRFIEMLQSAGDAGNASLEAILQSVQNANQTWKEAGVQFWVRSIERYVMPHFYNMAPALLAWGTVQPELVGPGTPFPNAPPDAWSGQHNDKPGWLKAVAAVYAAPNEVTVWLKDDDGHGYYCRFPGEGRSCVWNGWALTHGDVHEPAHELGHYLGLVHTFDDLNGHNDPSIQQPFKRSDLWDLVFKQGTSAANPNTYYDSKSAAAADEASLQLIDKNNGNCARDNSGVVSCDIGNASYSEHLTEGDYGMKGTAFPHADGHGDNVMSYLGPRVPPRDISDSQIAVARKFLRWDQPFRTKTYNGIYTGFHYTPPVTSGQRPRLGSWRQRQIAAKLDFDGDSLRDIGIWIPPTTLAGTGEFIVLLSSHGYSQSAGQYMDVQLGGLGDTPVPADYSGDGRTDLAVYQPGGGINRDDMTNHAAYWRWCPTATPAEATSCASPAVFQFGWREDAPEPGLDFDGSAPDAVAVYRPSNGAYYFQELNSPSYRKITISSGNSGAVPLPGQYDCDDLDDLAVYEPMTAEFKLVRSMQNWDASQMTTRYFDGYFVPGPSGVPATTGGVVPVPGQRYVRWCWNGYWYSLKPRLSAVLYYPQAGTWNMLMDPTGSSSVTSCTWGSGGVMPIGGVDWNGDGQSDMAYFSNDDAAYYNAFYFKATTWSDCSGNTMGIEWGDSQRIRQRAFGVSDMTGDGINEIMIVDPDQGIVRWLKSDSGYGTEDSRTFGSSYMEVL